MKVCLDIQSAIAQRAGVGRYTRLLVQHLGLACGDDSLLLFYFDFRRQGVPFEAANTVPNPVRWCPGQLAQAAWKTLGWPPFSFFSGPADLYHFPNFIIPPLNRGRTVVSIHDMSFFRFPQFTEEKNRAWLSPRIRDTASRADAILTISDFSAAEIHELLKVDRARIFTTYPGIGEEFSAPASENVEATLASLGIERPYLLTVGTLEPRKNIPFLVEVFEKLSDFDGVLVIAGMPGWKYEPILERIRASSRSADIRYVRYVSDAQLPALYAGASLFVFPSFYEGFGFPPLEAMACGTPVLSSAGGSLPEALGDGAVVLDSFNPDRWVASARRLLSDSEYRRRQIEQGRRQAAKYTWTETAKKTWDVYRSVG